MPSRVLALVNDMFFASKIRATAAALGIEVHFVRGVEDVIERTGLEKPSLIIVDLHATRDDPFEFALLLKARNALRGVPFLAFYSHVQTELLEKANAVGYERVIPRSAFSKNLAQILAGK